MQRHTLMMMLILSTLLVNLNLFVLQAETQSGVFPVTRKVTKLRFYVQDIIGGDNLTVWKVAQSDLTDVLPSAFGLVSVLDNPLTSGPEIDSEEVGRMQGAVGLSDLRQPALVMLLNGRRNPLGDDVREVPVAGGTGAFRMASGYVITTTYYHDEARIRDVYEYNVVVVHMDDAALLSRE